MSDCGRRWVPPSTLKREDRPISTLDESHIHEKLERPGDQSLDDFIFRTVSDFIISFSLTVYILDWHF